MAKNPTPSFQVIKDDLLQKIRDGYWRPGDTIPGEETLAEQYNCSRMTVNRAVRELAELGILERKRKSGTKVVRQPERAAKFQIPLVRHEIEQSGAIYRYVLLEKQQLSASEALGAKMALKTGAPVLYVRCLHFADERPYQFEERWINLQAVPKAGGQSFETISPNEWLIEAAPFCEAEHSFSACNATPVQADLLGVKPNDALFQIERRTQTVEAVITLVRLLHPGATYKLISRSP